MQHDAEPVGIRVVVVAGNEEVLRARRFDGDEQPCLVSPHCQAMRHILGSAAYEPASTSIRSSPTNAVIEPSRT